MHEVRFQVPFFRDSKFLTYFPVCFVDACDHLGVDLRSCRIGYGPYRSTSRTLRRQMRNAYVTAVMEELDDERFEQVLTEARVRTAHFCPPVAA